nr:MAG: VP2 [Polyomaviridae sp.]
MGALISLFAELVELGAITGFGTEAILAGEAAAAVEAEIAALTTIEGLSELEALSALGLTGESYALLSSAPSIYATAVGVGSLLQTLSGASSLVAAGVRTFGWDNSIPETDPKMALVPYWEDPDILYPGVLQFTRALRYFDPAGWAQTLYNLFRNVLVNYVAREGPRQIAYATTEVAREAARRSYTLGDYLARLFENTRWAVTAIPRNVYQALDEYYSELPTVRPSQARQLAARLGAKIPEQVNVYEEEEISGEFVTEYAPPGGAGQRVAADWLLPFLLGLYGAVPAVWAQRLEAEAENGPQAKKRRDSSTQAADKRRNRSSRAQNRRR